MALLLSAAASFSCGDERRLRLSDTAVEQDESAEPTDADTTAPTDTSDTPDCLAEPLPVLVFEAAESHATLAFPPDYTLTSVGGAGVDLFANGDGTAFGFALETDWVGTDLRQAHSEHLLLAAEAGFPPVQIFSEESVLPDPTWMSQHAFEPFPVVRDDLRYDVPSQSAASVRDRIAAAISGHPMELGASDAPCETVRSVWNVRPRPDGTLLTTALFACAARLEEDAALWRELQDVFDGNVVAPAAGWLPKTICVSLTELVLPPPQLELDAYPVPQSMRVFMDGAELPFAVSRDSSGWLYDASYNALQLWGSPITRESVLDVSALCWAPRE